MAGSDGKSLVLKAKEPMRKRKTEKEREKEKNPESVTCSCILVSPATARQRQVDYCYYLVSQINPLGVFQVTKRFFLK